MGVNLARGTVYGWQNFVPSACTVQPRDSLPAGGFHADARSGSLHFLQESILVGVQKSCFTAATPLCVSSSIHRLPLGRCHTADNYFSPVLAAMCDLVRRHRHGGVTAVVTAVQ